MINEAVLRSPKWMRNFLDFEINTGKDIKGEPSEKEKRRLEEERRESEKRKEEERRESEKRKEEEFKKEAMNIFDSIKSYIVDYYYKCDVTVNGDDFIISKDELQYKNKNIEFRLNLHYREPLPKFTIDCTYDNRNISFVVSGYIHLSFKTYIINTVYNYHKDKYKSSSSSRSSYSSSSSSSSSRSSSSSSRSSYSSSSDFNTYFRNKYGINPDLFINKSGENDNKKRRYNLLKNTLIGYERELFNAENGQKTSNDITTIKNEINNINKKIKDMKTNYKFEKLNNLKHIKRFNS
jgi:hypothetical protein